MLARHLNLLRFAAENLARNARGYVVAGLGLLLASTLLLSGIAISEGLKQQALAAVRSGADVYCGWDRFGRDAALPRVELERLEGIEGVERAVPRIIGRAPLAGQLAVVIGVPLAELERHALELEGALPRSGSEVLIGSELARETGLVPGAQLALEAETIRLFRVAGVVRSSSALWSAKAVVCELSEAAQVFGDAEHVSDVCLYTRAGYEQLVAEAVTRLDRRFRVQTRTLVGEYVVRGMNLREGVFTLLWALALALAIPAFAVLSFQGLSPRRREIGLLKAEGWATGEVMEMVALENLLVSALIAGGSLILALIWVELLRAPLIAPFFLADLPLFPAIDIPARFTPLPPILALVFSLTVTMTGSIWGTWRAATTRPVEVLR